MDYISRESYLQNCHNIYDKIHGEDKINKIFNIITHNVLMDFIDIYKNNIFRIANFEKYFKINSKLNKEYIPFYVNSIQHYLDYLKYKISPTQKK